MRVLFVSQYFHPEPFSNTRIAQFFEARGDEVEVLTAVPNYPQGEFYPGFENGAPSQGNFGKIKVHRVRTIARGSSKVKLLLNYLCFALFGSIKAVCGRFQKPDLIFLSQLSPVSMALPAIILSWRYRVPLVYWVQDIWPESATHTLKIKNKAIVYLLSAFSGWLYRRAGLVFVQSKAFEPMLTRFGVPADKISWLPNAGAAHFKPLHIDDATEEGKVVPQSGFRIMFAGNIGESQDFDSIIEAARILKDRANVKWVIIGSGRDLTRVKKKVAELKLGDSFFFLGRHDEKRMPKFFAHADAMLVSLKKNDIFALTIPYKVQGYLACGKTIIASLDGEGARIIEEAGAGITVPAESPIALAEKIQMLVKDFGERRGEFEANSRAYFEENFTEELVNQKLINGIVKVLEAQ